MTRTTLLNYDALYHTCNPLDLPFQTTESLEPFQGFFGQGRAIEAMEFGINMQRHGYNLFVMGNPHTGRFSFAMENLKNFAKKSASASDWCYIKNMSDARYPVALQLPAGKAKQLKQDIESLLENLLTELPAAFESPGYQRLKSRVERGLSKRYDQAVDQIERKARPFNIAVYRDAGSIGFTPLSEGQAMDEAAFSLLPEDERDAIQKNISDLEEELNEALTELPKWRRDAAAELRQIDSDTAKKSIKPLIEPLVERYTHDKGISKYLDYVQKDLIKNVMEIVGEERAFEIKNDQTRLQFLQDNYGVNILVDNHKVKGAPVIYEGHPSYENLFGRVEYNSEMGALVTNYSLIRSGALHRANGGYLLLEAEKLLEQPFVYSALKRALKSHEIRIENPISEYTGVSTITLNPEPIPLKVKVVLVGGRDTYYLLQELDHDFEKMFRVVVDFDEDVQRTAANIRNYARLMKTIAVQEGLGHLKRDAVARLTEHSSRLAEDQQMLSAHIGELVDLLCEADYRRGQKKDDLIGAKHVELALQGKEKRTSRLSEKIMEGMLNRTVLIDTQGGSIGCANGLTVLQVGDVAFGAPARITATVNPGNKGIVDIEREVTLGQPIHSKGVLILSGYLGHRYAQDFALSISASIAMEQSYGYIDGDSASLAEVCTLISATTGIPILQHFATTGSINQYGEVQAIGGVNEKIEGFFHLCDLRGLTGDQGVIIPKANVRNLMLKKEVVEAVKRKEFFIHAVENVDQCLEILMGRKAGTLKANGQFTQRSINALVVKRLREISTI